MIYFTKLFLKIEAFWHILLINFTERLFLLPCVKTNSWQTALPESNKTCEYINDFGIFNDKKYKLRLFDKIAAVLNGLMLSKMFFGYKFEICRLLRPNYWIWPNTKFINCQIYFFFTYGIYGFVYDSLPESQCDRYFYLLLILQPITTQLFNVNWRALLLLVEWFIKGLNFCWAGFPADCLTIVRKEDVLGLKSSLL